jgi:NADPH-dependent curcumin reductase CurA
MPSAEKMLMSSAVGSILIQIAKNVVGCKKVVGIAGGPDKCKW